MCLSNTHNLSFKTGTIMALTKQDLLWWVKVNPMVSLTVVLICMIVSLVQVQVEFCVKVKHDTIEPYMKLKSRIRETPDLSTNADSSTNIFFPLASTKGLILLLLLLMLVLNYC